MALTAPEPVSNATTDSVGLGSAPSLASPHSNSSIENEEYTVQGEGSGTAMMEENDYAMLRETIRETTCNPLVRGDVGQHSRSRLFRTASPPLELDGIDSPAEESTSTRWHRDQLLDPCHRETEEDLQERLRPAAERFPAVRPNSSSALPSSNTIGNPFDRSLVKGTSPPVPGFRSPASTSTRGERGFPRSTPTSSQPAEKGLSVEEDTVVDSNTVCSPSFLTNAQFALSASPMEPPHRDDLGGQSSPAEREVNPVEAPQEGASSCTLHVSARLALPPAIDGLLPRGQHTAADTEPPAALGKTIRQAGDTPPTHRALKVANEFPRQPLGFEPKPSEAKLRMKSISLKSLFAAPTSLTPPACPALATPSGEGGRLQSAVSSVGPADSSTATTPRSLAHARPHRVTRQLIPLRPPKLDFEKFHKHPYVEEQYIIQERISEGTYGEVYRGECRRTGQTVALKRLKRLRGLDGFPLTSLREVMALRHIKYQREKLLGSMQEGTPTPPPPVSGEVVIDEDQDPLPCIIGLRDVLLSSEAEHDIFLIFDYAAHSMAGVLSGGRVGFEMEQVAYIFRRIVVTLSRLHKMGIIHRDIKADNLLLGNDGQVLLADFGLCAFRGSHGGGRDLTPSMIHLQYRPPEMLLGKAYGAKVDVWSVGCFLAQIFLGHPPFVSRIALSDKSKMNRPPRGVVTELEQLCNLCNILGPIGIDGEGEGGTRGGRHRATKGPKTGTEPHHRVLHELYQQHSQQAGQHHSHYSPFPSALFEPSPTFRQYRGFRNWFHQAVEERRQRYAREALTRPSVVLPLQPSPSVVDVLARIFTLDEDERPTAAQLLDMPFFHYADAKEVSQRKDLSMSIQRYAAYGSSAVLPKKERVGIEHRIRKNLKEILSAQPTSHISRENPPPTGEGEK